MGERGIREGFALPETHPPKARGLWKPGFEGAPICAPTIITGHRAPTEPGTDRKSLRARFAVAGPRRSGFDGVATQPSNTKDKVAGLASLNASTAPCSTSIAGSRGGTPGLRPLRKCRRCSMATSRTTTLSGPIRGAACMGVRPAAPLSKACPKPATRR